MRRRGQLALVVGCLLLIYLVGIGWGLPATEGWDDDGVAPRDFLLNVYRAYAPGERATYPPVHQLGLAVATAPFWVPPLLRAPSLRPADLLPAFLRPGTMTALALTARLIQVVMALVIVWAVARLAEEAYGARAAVWAAALAGLDAVLTYYAHTSNLDVPALAFASVALLHIALAGVRREPRRLRAAGLFIALAAGTKDQAAGLFVLAAPVAFAWLWALCEDAGERRALLREAGRALLGCVLLYAVVCGPLINPTGYAARVRFLLGPASGDYAQVPPGLSHLPALLAAMGRRVLDFLPRPALGALALGVGYAAAAPLERRRRFAALLPVLAAASFTLTFVLAARRSEHRFLLPQLVLLSAPAAGALSAAWEQSRGRALRTLAVAAVAWLGALCLRKSVAVDLALLRDPRLQVERRLAAEAAPGDSIEVYGFTVQLPRPPAQARVVRVDPDRPLANRNVLPGVAEVRAPYPDVASRAPDWIVAPRAFTDHYFPMDPGLAPPERAALLADAEARAYFVSLRDGTLPGYERVGSFACGEILGAPPPQIHASTCQPIDVLRRRERAAGQ